MSNESRDREAAEEHHLDLRSLHARVLDLSLSISAVAAPFAAAMLVAQAAGDGSLNTVIWTFSGASLSLPLLWLLRRRLSFERRAAALIVLLLWLGLLLRLLGGLGAGPTLLNVLGVVLSCLIFGARGAIASVAGTVVLLGVAAWLVLAKLVAPPSASLWDATQPIVWVRTTALVGLFCWALAAAVLYVVQRLEADALRLREALVRQEGERKQHETTQRALEHSQRLEALGRMAGGIAHDFNNALMVVLAAAEEASSPGSTPDEVRAALADIQAAARSAAQLTSGLLVFGRRDAAHPKPVALAEALPAFERSLRHLLPAQVSLIIEPAGGTLLVDRTQLDQAVVNLVLNARDSITGPGEIRLRAAEQQVALPPAGTAARPGRYCVLSVKDTGSGMDEEVQRRLFEPFFTTKAAGSGTGLGAAIVHTIVERAGGFIELDSAPGRGTEFRLYFPAV